MDFVKALEIIQVVAVLLCGVILHEYAHGWVAERLGDSTARDAGRLSLNPLRHIDPIGTILVPLIMKWLGLLPLGWAKPVPVDYRRLRNPRRDMVLVAAAGPAVNVTLVFIAAGLMRLSLGASLESVAVTVVVVNMILTMFNLLPIPPLDGSRILMGILPTPVRRVYAGLERYGIIILIVLLNLRLLDFISTLVVFFCAKLGIAVSFAE